MMKKVLVTGFLGNMGTRYTKILDYLNISWVGVDYKIMGNVRDSNGVTKMLPKKFPGKDVDGIIIATSTKTHADYLRIYKDSGVPILCEKPITTDLADLKKLVSELKAAKTNFSMVDQYRFLVEKNVEGPTIYNYFKHGSDGLYWDCIQPISLARGPIFIGEDSPVWTCFINGQRLSIEDMDKAYIQMIMAWVNGRHQTDLDELLKSHSKVKELEAQRGTDRSKAG